MSEGTKLDGEAEIYRRLLLLEERNTQLMEQAKRVEGEKRFVQSELERLQREQRRLKNELDRLKAPPLIIGNVRDILSDGRVVVKSSTGPDFVVNVSDSVDIGEVTVGARVALNKQTLAVMSLLPSSLDPIVTGAEVIEKPSASYAEIGGLEKQLVEVREAVEDPLLRPELYKKVGIEPPKGVLLVGPPGTGKTLIAKAVAHNTNATFIRLVGSELVQKYIGEGARLVRELFELAKLKAPSIVFIDELDSVGAKRLDAATSGDREVQRTLMQLLAELDGFNPLGNVKIIAASNRPDILDDALLRPGRFDRIIRVPPPNFDARKEIFRIHTARMNIDSSIDYDELATKTEGATGADIHAICTEAGMFAIREGRDSVMMTDFEKSVSKVLGEEVPHSSSGEAGPMFA
ncbi:MAG: proteasome-activating nucleotidase [Thermoplasmata archaeon]|uniref:Proteasome-activating nucleotidase n=1 Tax=Candidatus Sysuiplasma superficiale TaxID=2823368 RepID=A0A8J7YWH6_9ARCH|nr:proteasome-activating nucleotidase [Candidatus Sysuiplasma superficiale]MBX8644119.1 proteasome-activating nucleotidase [Candidatus Sysuiplasma superficiale]